MLGVSRGGGGVGCSGTRRGGATRRCGERARLGLIRERLLLRRLRDGATHAAGRQASDTSRPGGCRGCDAEATGQHSLGRPQGRHRRARAAGAAGAAWFGVRRSLVPENELHGPSHLLRRAAAGAASETTCVQAFMLASRARERAWLIRDVQRSAEKVRKSAGGWHNEMKAVVEAPARIGKRCVLQCTPGRLMQQRRERPGAAWALRQAGAIRAAAL